MPSLFDPKTRDAILDRIARLAPDRKPLWGRFTAPEMVCHVSCDLRHGLGELETAPPSGPLSHAPLNWLAIHVIPWPKGKGRSPPEFLATRPRPGKQTSVAYASWLTVLLFGDRRRRGHRAVSLAAFPGEAGA